MESAPPPRRGSLWWVVLALGAFAYVAVVDVARVHARGPSLADEELLLLGRHARLERGRQVRCEAEGVRALGELVALPGELAHSDDAGVQVRARATDGFGGALERLSTTQRTHAVTPGRVLVYDEALGAPVSMPKKSCLPVWARLSIARALRGELPWRAPELETPEAGELAADEEAYEDYEDDEGFDAEQRPAASLRAAKKPIQSGEKRAPAAAAAAQPKRPQGAR